MKIIPYGHQSLNKADIEAVVQVLRSDWITQGPNIEFFERKLAQYCGAKYAVVVSSGTAALHLACLAAGFKKKDEVITSPITFLATPNAILQTGATPIFADINISTKNIDPYKIIKKVTRKTKGILPVHYAGLPCDMINIHAIAKRNKLIVIEDAAHALGAKYKSNGQWIKIGSCKHSHMTVFSFHPIKHITTGEGGAITTNNKRLYNKLKALCNHGLYKSQKGPANYHWAYEMRDLGFNYRITDFQCALGVSQLKRINQFIGKRRRIAGEYDRLLKYVDNVYVLKEPDGFKSSYHLYVIRINFDKVQTKREILMRRLKKQGIGTQVHYSPCYTHPYYKEKFGDKSNRYPLTEQFYKETVSIPIFVDMTLNDVRYVVKYLANNLRK